MKYKLSLFTGLLLFITTLTFGQVEFDSTKCINQYTNDSVNVYTLAAKDTCMVELDLGYPISTPIKFNWDSLSKLTFVVPASISKIKNLSHFSIQTEAFIKVEKADYNYRFMWLAFIKGKLTKESFPSNFFDSPILNSLRLVFHNEIKALPSAITNRKGSKEYCRLMLLGRNSFNNNSETFFKNLLKIVTVKNYSSIEVRNAKFTEQQKQILVKSFAPNEIEFTTFDNQ